MKQFNLEEYLANPSRKVVTRAGKRVKIYCTNYIGAQNIIAEIENSDYSTSFHKDGRYLLDGEESPCDLFFVPEKHEGWVNIYRGSDGSRFVIDSPIFTSKEEAEKEGKSYSDHALSVKIKWEE